MRDKAIDVCDLCRHDAEETSTQFLFDVEC